MDLKIYAGCLIAGVLGILFHLILNINKTKKRFNVANLEFDFGMYVKGEIWALIASLLTVVIATYLIDELANFRPEILEWIKFFFVFVGYSGSSLLVGILGKANSYVNKVVDAKTDIADEKN